jgi:hypothetical protein
MPSLRFARCLFLVAALFGAACRDAAGPPMPSALAPVGASEVTAAVGAEHPVAVRVIDAGGRAVGGVAVQWSVASGSGSVTPASGTTDGAGEARAAWRLGTSPGAQSLTARVEGLAPLTLRATATPGRPAQMTASASLPASYAAGSALAERPSVVVRDEFGNAVPGVAVEFVVSSGGGTVSEGSQVTDVYGVAAAGRWRLGPTAGPNTLAANVVGLQPFDFSVEARPFNAAIESVHLNQGNQTAAGGIGAVSGRPGLLRVVVRASEANSFAPAVRVRLFQGTTLLREARIEAPGTSVPTNPALSNGQHTWNLMLSAAEVVPGLAVEAALEADPQIPDAIPADDRFPRAGGALPLDARPLAPLRIVFIPVHASVQGRTGNVSASNVEMFLADTRRWIPSSTIETAIRPTYTTSLDLGVGDNWFPLVMEIQAIRTLEGAVDEYYHGIVPFFPGTPWGGFAYILPNPGSPFRSGVTFDASATASQLLAHELGHNFGRRHSPCGNALGIDPAFPHPNAGVGSPGFDILGGGMRGVVGMFDYMSYCNPQWTSDHTYSAILAWRRQDPLARWPASGTRANTSLPAAAPETDGLLVWGRVGADGATLNPAFRLRTRPVLPADDGPNEIRGVASDGTLLFRFRFDGVPVAHGEDRDERHFAYFVPLHPTDLERVDRIELVTSGTTRVQRSASTVGTLGEPARPAARLESLPGERTRLRWEAAHYPMGLVRDPRTGHVLAIGRGGRVDLQRAVRGSDRLEVVFSDGARSRTETLRVEP